MLPPIFDVSVYRLFLFCRLTTEWPSEWDMILWWPPSKSERNNAAAKLRGRNDIQVKRQYRYGKWQFGWQLKKQIYESMDRFQKNADRLSTVIASIGLWPHNPNPQPEGVRTILRGKSPEYPCKKIKHKNGDDIFWTRKTTKKCVSKYAYPKKKTKS